MMILITEELIRDNQLDLESCVMDLLIRKLNDGIFEPKADAPQAYHRVIDCEPDVIVEAECPDECERCGKSEGTSLFRGWRHDPSEGEYLCGDCFDTATMEE